MKLVISETINGVVQVTEKESVVVISDFDTGASAVPLATVTSKGSIIVGTGNATVGELVVGANGTIPIADSAQVTGMRWGAPAGSFSASDAENRTMSANLTLTNADAYVQFCDPGGASRDINLPAVGVLNHPYWIYNSADADETLTVKNAGGTVIGILTRGKSGLFVSSNAGWSGVVDVLAPDINGWIPVLDTWTYVSAFSFKVSGDKTGVIVIGDCIKFTQGGTVKKFLVVNSSYSAPDTTFTVTAGSTYSVANDTITSPYYSHIHPVDFPKAFGLTTPTWTTTGTAFTNQPTSSASFWMVGRNVHINITGQGHATSGGTGEFIATFTTGQLPQPITTASGLGTARNASNSKMGVASWDSGTPNAVRVALYDATALFGNGQYFSAMVIGAL